ncbi:hypothetical protein JCM10213_002033 [Rhodosporidiobolus nylandii]
MSAVAPTSTYSLQAKDAAAKEREDRLLAAKKKLKLYRARTSQRLGSSSSTLTDTSSSPIRPTRRQSGLGSSSISSQADFTAKHAHRRSQSKSGLLAAMGGDAYLPSSSSAVGGLGHARRMSKNRMSRSSISMLPPKTKGHGHNRSRASISMSFSGRAPQLAPPLSAPEERSITPTPRQPSGLGAPSSWTQSGAFPSSPEVARPLSISRSTSPLPPAPAPGPPNSIAKHGRHGSRHTRRSSVSNFRESLDLVGGGHHAGDPSHLRPGVSSFAATEHGPVPSPSVSTTSSPHQPGNAWSAASSDPHQVLAALKERGRRETDDPSLSPEQTRQSALEALEGRISAPSEMISLGTAQPGELLVAPRSPGYTAAGYAGASSSPLPPTAAFSASPMIGLGVSSGPGGMGGKRSSWGAGGLSGVAGVGAQGVMELGGIAEEDEEEEEESFRRSGASPVSSPKQRSPKRASPSPRKSRPASLFVDQQARSIGSAVATSEEPAPEPTPSLPASPTANRRTSLRALSLSLSASTSGSSSAAGTPSTAAAAWGAASSRRDSLAAPSSPESDMRAPSSPGESRRISMFHSAAALGLDPTTSTPSSSPGAAQSALYGSQRGGLRSLSIGAGAVSPSSAAADRRFPGRAASVSNPLLSASAPASSTPHRKAPSAAIPPQLQKRSSISYRTSSSSASSAFTPEGGRRTWRNSLVGAGAAKDSSPAVSTAHYSSFPFGVTGGFGDLELDGADDNASSVQPSPLRTSFGLASTNPTSPTRSASTASAAAAAAAAAEEISSLRLQVSSLEARNAQLASTHALEIEEFEKKASDEAGDMRARIAALEAQVEDERVQRRFEVEGLGREVEMAKEAIGDLTDERDSLREDVDGWRTRCANLEQVVKKEREDEALAQAQAKLIGEMRDQIYTLVAALERERGEHAETRREVERMLEERVREAAAEAQAAQAGRRDDLALIMEEEEDEPEHEQQHGQQDLGAAAGNRHHPYKTASDGSMLSTASSTFSRSYSQSGNTTEDTSILTDYDDSFGKLSSPPSGNSSFSAVVGGAFPPPASANPNRNSVIRDDVAAALGQLDTLAEEDEEDEEALIGGGATPATVSTAQYGQQLDGRRAGSTSTASTSSDVMPRTPDRSQAEHNRSHSFVRHWSFPRGSVTSARPSLEDEDSSFFGYNKHDSLPPLPLGDHVLPPFLTGSIEIDEDHFSFFPPQQQEGTVETANHVRRPSSPRPLERMQNPHLRRVSGQFGKAPPPSPSALVTAALQHQQQSSFHLQQQQQPAPRHAQHPSAASSISSGASPAKNASRYSFGALIGSALGGWSPSSSASLPPSTLPPPPAAASKLALSSSVHSPVVEEEEEDDSEGVEEDMFITTHGGPTSHPHGTPVQLQHQNQHQTRLRYIAKHEVPQPRAGKLSKLDFSNSVCCLDMPVFVV